MKTLHNEDIRSWYASEGNLAELSRTIGQRYPDGNYLENQLGVPFHLRWIMEKIAAEEGEIPAAALESIPFYSLCRGLFLPLSYLEPDKCQQVFGLQTDPPPDAPAREELLRTFLDREIGLTLAEKLACILGDPFLGRKSTIRRDSLLRLLQSVSFKSRNELLDRLTQVGDVAVLYAESRHELRANPPLTAAEVFRCMKYLPDERLANKFQVLRGLLLRCGKVEAYFLAKLALRKAAFGFDYQGPLLARVLADRFGGSAEQVNHAMALTDVFHVADVLQSQGPDGLRAIQLQPLVPVRPALAGGASVDLEKFPVWVERKYDGIRFMLHKSTDQHGSILCGAYTRNRGDWLEMVPGLDSTIRMVPAHNVILDGELYGTILDLEGMRPATVYEVYAALQGDVHKPVNMRFAAFDICYLNGQDLTPLPLSKRREILAALLAPLAVMQLPVPITISEGQMANHKDDVNRLYHHFRAQGYEGIITKDLNGTYHLASRDPSWTKRKPEITLDLVLLGATYAVTTKTSAGVFGSYVIGARHADGTFEFVGDVAGVDRVRDEQIRQEIMREGLLTGRRIERPSSSGARTGVELKPAIVVTVKFEGIVRDGPTGKLSLRDPKLAMIRSDKSAHEADLFGSLEELYLRQRVG